MKGLKDFMKSLKPKYVTSTYKKHKWTLNLLYESQVQVQVKHFELRDYFEAGFLG